MDWPLPGIRRVSVNCFGFGGTNAHVIMDEAPEYLQSRGLIGNHSSSYLRSSSPDTPCFDTEEVPYQLQGEYQLFCYSAHEKSAVSRIMSSHSEYLKSQSQEVSPKLLTDYSYTLGSRRSTLEWKGFVVAKSISELAAKLETAGSANIVRSLRKEQPRIGFLFSGQGGTWAKMGMDLMQFEVFKASMAEASDYMQLLLYSPFNLLQEILRDESASSLSSSHIAQPATTAIQVALVDLLHLFGIAPMNVLGHSSGEIAAAYAGGAISRHEAWRIAYYRGLAAISVQFRAPTLKGGMMVVGMSLEQTRQYLEDGAKSAEIACVNSPHSITISGKVDALHAIAADLEKRRIFHHILPVATAYHSSHMRLVERDYRDSLAGLSPGPLRVRMFSSLTGKFVQGDDLNPHYWSDNFVNPVEYVEAMTAMMEQPLEDRPDILIEIGPRGALRSPTADTLASIIPDRLLPTYYSVLQPKVNGVSKVLGLIGELWTQGCSIELDHAVDRGHHLRLKCLTDLPPYPWNHTKSYWHESHLSVTHRNRAYPRQDLIGAPTADSIPFEPRWRGFIRISENPWIQDHQVQKTIVYPAAGMISMVLEGAKQIKPEMNSFMGYEISDMNISKAMIIPSTEHGLEVALNIKMSTDLGGESQSTERHEFAIYSKHLDRDWEQHTTGFIQFKQTTGSPTASMQAHEGQKDKLIETCKKAMNPRQLYEVLDTMGMNYGPTFQNISDIYKGDGACVCTVRVPDTKSKMPSKFEYPHLLHPATLDSMFHSLFAIETVPMVPTFIKSLFVSAGVDQDGPKSFSGFATADKIGLQDACAKIVMNGCGSPKTQVVIDGLHLTALHAAESAAEIFLPNFRNLCTEIVWKEDAAFETSTELTNQIELLSHKYPGLAILQVGGTSQDAMEILKVLDSPYEDAPRLSKFTLLEGKDSRGSTELMNKVKGTPLDVLVECKKKAADIGSDYHLIISHDNAIVKAEKLRSYLKVDGVLMQLGELLTNGHECGNGISPPNGQPVNGSLRPPVESSMYKRTAPLKDSVPPQIILLIPEFSSTEIPAFVELLTSYKMEHGQDYRFMAKTSRQILAHSIPLETSVVISLLDIRTSLRESSSICEWDEFHFNLFKEVQKSAKGMIWVTRGAHMNPQNVEGSPIIGLTRTLMSEDPRKAIVTFDVDEESELATEVTVKNILAVFSQTFCEEAHSDYPEMEFAQKDGKIFIPRLRTIQPLNRIIEGKSPKVVKSRPFHNDMIDFNDKPDVKLSIGRAGLSDDSWHYTEFRHTDILPDEVDIKFGETLLTSHDVETVLGHSAESTIGLDVRGTITRVGRNVAGFHPGDEVTALVSGGSIQSTSRVKASLIQRHKTVFFPSLLVSAYFAIVYMGRARPGKSVLVHAGASAHGLAAIELANLVGATVFVTVAGSDVDNQRKILEDVGLPSSSIFNAEDEFVPRILAETKGEGVDVVYNTTHDNLNDIAKCVKNCKLRFQSPVFRMSSVLTRSGGFIVQLPSAVSSSTGRNFSFAGNVAVINFDLRQLLRVDEDFVAELLESASGLLVKDQFDAPVSIPLTTNFGIDALGKALKHVHNFPYHGLCTLKASSEDEYNVCVLCDDNSKRLSDAIDPEGTYLLAGGLGGLGRSISELLLANGAKHLAFISRSGASNSHSSAFVKDMQSRGTDVKVYQADICDKASLSTLLEDRISVEMPPILGVFQCAAVIQDSVFDNMTYTAWDAATKPKIQGSWNLVKTLSNSNSDPFFVFLASSAGVIGNRGQANYAAGNSFKDALAHHCRLQGTRAVSIDLGPVLGAGMLAEDDDMLDKLRAAGFYGIRHDDFLTVVKHAITMEMGPAAITTPAQVILGVGTGGLMRQNKPADAYWSRTALYSYLNLIDMPPLDLNGPREGQNMNMKALLARCSSPEFAVDLIRTGLSNMLAKAMNLLPEEVDVHKAPNTYGVDSLVAVGIRNWVLSNCNVEVSVFEVLSNDTILEMAGTIAQRGGYGTA